MAVHAYGSIATDRPPGGVDGRTFEYRDGDRYEEIPVGNRLETVFAGWEEARPRPRDPDAVRALLERHRAPASSKSPA